jgi:hypothetical protein
LVLLKIKKQDNINHFFSRMIWNMTPVDVEASGLDEETWTVKGRFQGKEILLTRRAFKDSTYYSNLQTLLDICKIKDYKYKKIDSFKKQ